MKHPLYENDYTCYLSINPKYIIEEKKEKQIENIIIIINETYIKIKEIIESIVYLLKSLPENSCSFNILYQGPLFKEFLKLNENNIQKIIKKLDNYSCNYSPEILRNIQFVKEIKEKVNRVFIIGDDYYGNLDNMLNEIDKFSDYNCKFFTITTPYLYD
jgi:hypothetical protein